MFRNTILAVAAAAMVTLLTPGDAAAWGVRHVGYTHVGPAGVYHAGRTTVGGPVGGYSTGRVGAVGYGGGAYRAGYGVGYGTAGYAGGYRYGAVGGAGYAGGVYRRW